jgi:hypothetical protein
MERFNTETQARLLTGSKNPKKFIATYNYLVIELRLIENAFTVKMDELLSISNEDGSILFKFTPKCREQESCLQLAILSALVKNNLLTA